MLIPARQTGQPRPWRNTSLAHDSQKRCSGHMAPAWCVRHAQPRGRPRNSRRWQLLYLVQLRWRWHKLLLIDRNLLVIIYVVKSRLAFRTSLSSLFPVLCFLFHPCHMVPRFPVWHFLFSHFQRPLYDIVQFRQWKLFFSSICLSVIRIAHKF